MNYGIIYCAYNKINQKRYIGQTIQRLSERKAAHYSKDKEIYFHRALHKYAESDWEWSVIDTAENKEELDQKEIYWIAYYKTTNSEYGYNILSGGSNTHQTKDQIRYARDKFVQQYSSNKNITKTIRNIKCIETDQIFKNAAEASRAINVHHSHIVAAANGNLKSAGGYHWEWCINIALFPNAIYCKELDKVYLNYNDACKQDHFSGTHLSRALKNKVLLVSMPDILFIKLMNNFFLNYATTK